ncbi:plant/F25P12-18 protein [Senna tora]|uniref:Plant/F25P12-18 protein n=1 Tax=Senna tora TaxID=362788 RepID=A0A834X4U2_9FABA|nr:plant/F25P12-18 protein [Senna tora]
MSLITEELKAKAEVFYGDQVCKEKFSFLLAEIGLPDGLLTTTFQQEEENMIEECGFVKEIGFVWLKLQKKKEHRFENIQVCLDTEVTAFLEPNKIKNLRGVKARDFLVWFTLNEIYVRDPPPPKASVITFKSLVGLSMSFPVSLFKSDKEEQVADQGEVKMVGKRWKMIKL